MKLRKDQMEDAYTMADRKFCLNASELGVGKTAVALHASQFAKADIVLIICPATIKRQWKNEILKWFYNWLIREYHIQIIQSGKDVIVPETDMYYCIINYDLIIKPAIFKQLMAIKWDTIICDESHRLKEPKAKRTKAILGKKGLVHNTKSMYLLTGTPVLNRPIELWTAMSVLAPDLLEPYNTWHKYVYRFCAAYKDRFGVIRTEGASNLDDLKRRLSKFMIRRLADDTLPDVTYQDVELENEYEPELDTPIATVRRLTAMFKVDQCVPFIEGILEEVDKVVVFFYHKNMGERLRQELINYYPLRVYGGMDADKKELAITGFQAAKMHRVFLLQVDCAEGINGLQIASHVGIFVEQSYSPSVVKQCVGRLNRTGQEHPVLIYNLIAANSIEERIEIILARKERIIGELI